MEKEWSFQQMVLEDWHTEERSWILNLHHTQNISSKQIKDLNIRAKTIKPLEENIDEKLYNTESGNDLLEYGTKAQIINNKLEFIKIKKAFASKDTINSEKVTQRMKENIFKSCI